MEEAPRTASRSVSARALWAALFAIGCAGTADAGRPHTAVAGGGCTDGAQCPHGYECLPPGAPVCGGAVDEPIGECPSDHPHPVSDGCRTACVAEPPLSCADGFVCADGATCRPGEPGRDQHDCVHEPCSVDRDCGAGRCITGRCYDREGRCEMIPS